MDSWFSRLILITLFTKVDKILPLRNEFFKLSLFYGFTIGYQTSEIRRQFKSSQQRLPSFCWFVCSDYQSIRFTAHGTRATWVLRDQSEKKANLSQKQFFNCMHPFFLKKEQNVIELFLLLSLTMFWLWAGRLCVFVKAWNMERILIPKW